MYIFSKEKIYYIYYQFKNSRRKLQPNYRLSQSQMNFLFKFFKS